MNIHCKLKLMLKLKLLDGKSQLIGKDPDAGKDRRQEEKGMTENVTVRWHHGFNGCDFEPIPGDSEGQRNLAH